MVGIMGQLPLLGTERVKLFQREGQKRQGVVISGVFCQPLDESRLNLNAEPIRRTLDDLSEARPLHGIESDLLVPLGGALEPLKSVQEVRAHGPQHHRPSSVDARIEQQTECGPCIRSFGRSKHLLELIEDEEEGALWHLADIEKVAADGAQAPRVTDLLTDGIELGSAAGFAGRERERSGQPLQPLASHERWRNHPIDPAGAVARVCTAAYGRQARQHTRSNQRGFAASGGTENDDEAFRIMAPPSVEHLHDVAYFLLSSKEYRGIPFPEGVETEIWPIRQWKFLPETFFCEAVQQALPSRFHSYGGEADELPSFQKVWNAVAGGDVAGH